MDMLHDKDFWVSIQASGFAVPAQYTPADLLPELLDMLGCLDGDFRDKVCWRTLDTWISKGLYSADEIRGIIPGLLDGLRAGIGEFEGDSAFRRSFSALTLASVAEYDFRARLLTPDEIRMVFSACVDYIRDEQDLRGYVGDKGWVDGTGHALDLMSVLVQYAEIGKADLERLLSTVETKLKASTPRYPHFVSSEGFRLGEVFIRIVRRGELPIEDLVAWIQRFDRTGKRSGDDYYCGRWHKVMDFLTALYAQLNNSELPSGARESLTPVVLAVLKTYCPAVALA